MSCRATKEMQGGSMEGREGYVPAETHRGRQGSTSYTAASPAAAPSPAQLTRAMLHQQLLDGDEPGVEREHGHARGHGVQVDLGPGQPRHQLALVEVPLLHGHPAGQSGGQANTLFKPGASTRH